MAIDDSRKSAQFTLYSSWNVQHISAKSIEEREPKEIDDDFKMMQNASIENCISTRQKTTDRKVFVLFLFFVKTFLRAGVYLNWRASLQPVQQHLDADFEW